MAFSSRDAKKSEYLKHTHLYFFFILLFFNSSIFPQAQLVEVANPVYEFLQRMHISGNLDNYDDVVLPFSEIKITVYLTKLDRTRKVLSVNDQKLLDKFLLQFLPDKNNLQPESLISDDHFIPPKILFEQKENHLYVYTDSLFTFQFDGVLSFRNYFANNYQSRKGNSSILSSGGSFIFDYKTMIGVYASAWNGPQFGDREIAKIDQQTAQSFSFNSTKIRYVDGTKGSINFQNDFASLVFGRERILWGTGSIHKIGLDKTPQMFDFIKFNFSYKKFQYDFLHGWLVESPYSLVVDSVGDTKKNKLSKYIAINRIGFSPLSNLRFGITQAIIYANRPLEAAYLNPFLLWESAQRSMNDLDNSFLTFDFRYRPTKGLLLNSSILLDDINFNNLFNGKWSTRSNGTVIQIGAEFIPALISEKLFVQFDYLQIRPFTFSHPSLQSSLSYTNNGFFLGPNFQPNSSVFTSVISYYFNEEVTTKIKYEYYVHGENVLNANGKVIDNVGGDVFSPEDAYTPFERFFLAGNLAKISEFQFVIDWQFAYAINAEFMWQLQNLSKEQTKEKSLFFALIFSYNFRSLN